MGKLGWLIGMYIAFSSGRLYGQMPVTFTRDTISRTFLSKYQAALGPNSGIFNGPKAPSYREGIKGSPYFGETDQFQPGWVIFNGFMYDQIPIKFDEYSEALITRYHTNNFELTLRSDLVQAFSIAGHNFTNIKAEDSISYQIPTGYYEILYDGNHRVLARRQRTIKDFADIKDRAQYFDPKVTYYLRKNNEYHAIRDTRGLKNIFREQRVALNKYMRSNAIDFKANPDRAIKMVAAWSDNLK